MSKKIQIAFGNSDIFGVDISYYCEDAMQIGDLCFLKPNKAHNLVTTYELAVKEYLEIIGPNWIEDTNINSRRNRSETSCKMENSSRSKTIY